jgi:AAA domain
MSYLKIQEAEKGGGYARVAIIGPSGSGKSFTSLRMATGMANGGKIGAIDTERGSLRKYADKFKFSDIRLNTFAPDTYVEAINEFAKAGFPVLVIDSMSHAWSGKDGALQQVEQAAKRSQSNNTYVAWREVTPQHNALVDACLSYPGHIIVTMRSKVEYVTEKDERTGKMSVRKVGTAPVQRADMEYEFDIVGEMNQENDFMVSKTRADFLKRAIIHEPDEEFGKKIAQWASEGVVEPLAKTQPDVVLLPLVRMMKEKKITKEAVLEFFGKSPRDMDDEEIDTFKGWLNNVEVPEI